MNKKTILSATMVAAFALLGSACGESLCGNGRIDRTAGEICDPGQDPFCRADCRSTSSQFGGGFGTTGLCFANQPTRQGCNPQLGQQCIPCQGFGGVGGQGGLCYPLTDPVRRGQPGCVQSSFQQCTPCSAVGGPGVGLCFANQPTRQGCNPQIPGQQCVPCQGGIGGQFGLCFAQNPLQQGCNPQLGQQCVPCQGGFGQQQCFPAIGGQPPRPGCVPNPAAGQFCVPCSPFLGGGGAGGGFCGDGIVSGFEQCDPPGIGGCSALCTLGDGFGGGGLLPPGILPPGGAEVTLEAYPIGCGDKIEFDTRAGNGGLPLNGYVCHEHDGDIEIFDDVAGPENIFVFQAVGDMRVKVDVDDPGGVKVDAFVLADFPDPGRCIMGTENKDRFYASAGRTYFIVADARPGRGGRYDIEIDCDFDDDGCGRFSSCGGFDPFGVGIGGGIGPLGF